MLTAKEQEIITAMKANLASFEQTGRWLFIYNLVELTDALHEEHYGAYEDPQFPTTTDH